MLKQTLEGRAELARIYLSWELRRKKLCMHCGRSTAKKDSVQTAIFAPICGSLARSQAMTKSLRQGQHCWHHRWHSHYNPFFHLAFFKILLRFLVLLPSLTPGNVWMLWIYRTETRAGNPAICIFLIRVGIQFLNYAVEVSGRGSTQLSSYGCPKFHSGDLSIHTELSDMDD